MNTRQRKFLNFNEWFERVRRLNRRLLLRPDLSRITGKKPPLGQYLQMLARRLLSKPSPEYWMTAINAIGAAYAHRSFGFVEELQALYAFFDRHLEQEGTWKFLPQGVDAVMKGYPLLYLAEVSGCTRYHTAAHSLARYLLNEYPRASDGSLLYKREMETVLVDSLGMVCPFLTRYGAIYDHPASRDTAANQILRFVEQNVDADTHLPYHAYYPDGSKRLGMQGWGRGTGWYMVGLVDTLADLPKDHPAYHDIFNAYLRAAHTLAKFQRPDGQWGWAILLRHARSDSSATAFLGYSLIRGLQTGLLDRPYLPVIKAAVKALMTVTRADGLLDGSLADCMGVGLYPTHFGPQPWLQGMGCALAALYAQWLGKENSALWLE